MTKIQLVPEPLTFNIRNAATFLGLGLTPVKKLLRDGVIPYRKAGSRTLILRADLVAFVDALAIGGARKGRPKDVDGRFKKAA